MGRLRYFIRYARQKNKVGCEVLHLLNFLLIVFKNVKCLNRGKTHDFFCLSLESFLRRFVLALSWISEYRDRQKKSWTFPRFRHLTFQFRCQNVFSFIRCREVIRFWALYLYKDRFKNSEKTFFIYDFIILFILLLFHELPWEKQINKQVLQKINFE